MKHSAAVKGQAAGGFTFFTTARVIKITGCGPTWSGCQPVGAVALKSVSTDGGGDEWCVDLKSKREVIWFFDHEAYGTFRHADIPTGGAFLEELRSPKPAEREVARSYVCKKGKPAADAAGDGSFCVKDTKGRDWLCFERRELTEEERMAEIMARVRGEVGMPMPAWIGEKGLRELSATSVEDLRECLSKQR